MSETDIIWFTGFYEGEGSISNDKSNNNRLKISISQNDKTPLVKAMAIWGGNISKRVRKSPVSDKICVGYEWRISHKSSLKFIDDIHKYMRIPYKINQMNKCIQKSKEGNDEVYKCNFCNKFYKNPSGRRRHEIKEHINKGQLHKCETCMKEYKSKDSLKRHWRLTTCNENK